MNGKIHISEKTLRLNSEKDVHIKDYVPESTVDSGAEVTQARRTCYKDSIKALILNKQILILLLAYMGNDDITIIRSEQKENLTA